MSVCCYRGSRDGRLPPLRLERLRCLGRAANTFITLPPSPLSLPLSLAVSVPLPLFSPSPLPTRFGFSVSGLLHHHDVPRRHPLRRHRRRDAGELGFRSQTVAWFKVSGNDSS